MSTVKFSSALYENSHNDIWRMDPNHESVFRLPDSGESSFSRVYKLSEFFAEDDSFTGEVLIELEAIANVGQGSIFFIRTEFSDDQEFKVYETAQYIIESSGENFMKQEVRVTPENPRKFFRVRIDVPTTTPSLIGHNFSVRIKERIC